MWYNDNVLGFKQYDRKKKLNEIMNMGAQDTTAVPNTTNQDTTEAIDVSNDTTKDTNDKEEK